MKEQFWIFDEINISTKIVFVVTVPGGTTESLKYNN